MATKRKRKPKQYTYDWRAEWCVIEATKIAGQYRVVWAGLDRGTAHVTARNRQQYCRVKARKGDTVVRARKGWEVVPRATPSRRSDLN